MIYNPVTVASPVTVTQDRTFFCRFLSREESSRDNSSETGQRERQFSAPEVIRFDRLGISNFSWPALFRNNV